MNELGIILGLSSFLLLAAVGQRISLAFAVGVAVLIVVSAYYHPEKKKKRKKKK